MPARPRLAPSAADLILHPNLPCLVNGSTTQMLVLLHHATTVAPDALCWLQMLAKPAGLCQLQSSSHCSGRWPAGAAASGTLPPCRQPPAAVLCSTILQQALRAFSGQHPDGASARAPAWQSSNIASKHTLQASKQLRRPCQQVSLSLLMSQAVRNNGLTAEAARMRTCCGDRLFQAHSPLSALGWQHTRMEIPLDCNATLVLWLVHQHCCNAEASEHNLRYPLLLDQQ
jgi:hypothetical protein